jgi:hypothetical protein
MRIPKALREYVHDLEVEYLVLQRAVNITNHPEIGAESDAILRVMAALQEIIDNAEREEGPRPGRQPGEPTPKIMEVLQFVDDVGHAWYNQICKLTTVSRGVVHQAKQWMQKRDDGAWELNADGLAVMRGKHKREAMNGDD